MKITCGKRVAILLIDLSIYISFSFIFPAIILTHLKSGEMMIFTRISGKRIFHEISSSNKLFVCEEERAKKWRCHANYTFISYILLGIAKQCSSAFAFIKYFSVSSLSMPLDKV